MCLYPKLIQNPKYRSNKKNGGNIPHMKDKRVALVPIGCQKCIECMKKKAREWQIRLLEEVEENLENKRKGLFVTMTFSNESYTKLGEEIPDLTGYNLDNAIATLAVRRFLERWRKKYKKSLRHWFVTELGSGKTEHLHLHGMIWVEKEVEERILKEGRTIAVEFNNIWGYGWTYPNQKQSEKNYVNARTANYVIKYINKVDKHHKEYKPKILCSPGIGNNYIKKEKIKRNTLEKDYYLTKTGHKIALPIYYRNYAYTEEEREQLWLERLDKQVRYVLGQEIDISQGEEVYYNVLKTAREKNARLGYGDDSANWEQKKYENQKRLLKQKLRTEPKKEYIEPKIEKIKNALKPNKDW